MKYDVIVSGGTFDLLHKGHKSFLEKVAQLGDKVIIGVTSDSYVSRFKNNNFEDYRTRERNVFNFLKTLKASNKLEIIEIDDIYGPLLDKNFKVSAVAVTPQTNRTVIGINEERKAIGIPEIAVEVIEMDRAEDYGLISSTRIRNGEINRDGRLYVKDEWINKSLKLPQEMRPLLQKPMGDVLKKISRNLDGQKIITIGDITTKEFNLNKINQILSIVDFQVQRKKKFEKMEDLNFEKEIKTIKIKNSAGEISGSIFEEVKKCIESNKKYVILIDGEEDLTVLPAVLVAPLGFSIYYGQPSFAKASKGKPNEGMVEIKVTEENKEKIFEIISKFTF